NDEKGFGFIEQSSGGKDVFFHRNVFSGADKSRLKQGLTVNFALESGDGSKLRAKGVSI
ncbi:MAG: cold shock domain-containing protein, partial [Thermoleophilia bacterium]|nr:cold shock domain-containing protein [Thermoleophilia bacterium]